MSKTIGNMTLKAAPVGTDMVAIADSEDLDKTKKVLLSALGGSDKIHILDDTVTFSAPTYSATCTGITSYEDGHFYLIKFPSVTTAVNVYTRYININSLGNVEVDYNYTSNWNDYNGNYYFPVTPEVSILLYRQTENKFYFVNSTTSLFKTTLYCNLVEAASNLYIKYAPVLQTSINPGGAPTPSVFITDNSSPGGHAFYTWPNSTLTSLTITCISTTHWDTEFVFTTGSTFTLTVTGTYWKGWLGVSAPTFEANATYVVVIKNGYGVYSKVGA